MQSDFITSLNLDTCESDLWYSEKSFEREIMKQNNDEEREESVIEFQEATKVLANFSDRSSIPPKRDKYSAGQSSSKL